MSTPPRTIGLDLLFVHGRLGGIRNCASGLCGAILSAAESWPDASFRLFVTPLGVEFLFENAELAEAAAALGSRCDIVSIPIDPRRKLRRLAWEQLGLHRHLGGVHLLHSFDYRMPYLSRCRNVVMIHDLNYLDHAETFTPSQHALRRVAVPLSLRFADKIVAISHAAKRAVEEHFGVTEDRIAVIHHGHRPLTAAVAPSGDDGSASSQGSDPHVLCVGTLLAHKNHERLLEAFALLGPRNLRLIIAGRDDGRGRLLRARADQLGIGSRVTFTGFVSDRELGDLYRTGSLLAFPSLSEGFGLPLLEAMAAGVPIACSDIPVFREIAAEAAEYFDPTDPADISRSLARALDDDELRRSLLAAGSKRSEDFSWQAAAQRMLAVYEEVLHAA